MQLDVSFLKSSEFLNQCPPANLPEYAFIGRSNVGKSSLINMLCNRKSLAMISSKPGKTKLINHFLVDKSWYLVDLPGYGYAVTSKSERKKFEKLINNYILKRRNLVNVFLLIDANISPQKNDLEFMQWLGISQIPFTIVFTKTDKSTLAKIPENIENYKKALLEKWEELPTMVITSANKKQGRDELLQIITNYNQEYASVIQENYNKKPA
ncbi:MAG: YihA family ribosome biogenesis GTP-binding protein [Bacteroidetes bacterium]|nr:YihA family ribosome biogenesis GTP-binding protein [Bacteroidota bacterium]